MGDEMDIRLSAVSAAIGKPRRTLFEIPELEVKKGAQVFVEGPSGFGKTTLLHLLAGLLQPDRGEIRIGDHVLGAMNDSAMAEFRRAHVGLVFQKLNLIDHLTVLENILLTLPAGNEHKAQAASALEQINIGHLSGRRTALLSLGEQQRVAVARILARKPEIVLADEPTSSLDDANANAVMAALQNLGKNTTLLVVSHDQRLRSRFKTVLDFKKWVPS